MIRRMWDFAGTETAFAVAKVAVYSVFVMRVLHLSTWRERSVVAALAFGSLVAGMALVIRTEQRQWWPTRPSPSAANEAKGEEQ